MKHSLFILSALATLTSTGVFAAESTPTDCLDRVRQEGCFVSDRDYVIAHNTVEKCRRVMSLGAADKLEVFLLKNSERVVVIKTRGPSVFPPYCPANRYEIDRSGAKDLKIINHHVFILSNDGALYMMEPNGEVFEVLDTKNTSYVSLVDIRQGKQNVRNLLIVGKTFQKEMTPEELAARKKVAVRFFNRTTRQSLFSDN